MSKLAKLNTIALTLLITGSIDSVRNLPVSALFGSSLVFFFILAAVMFLIPTALVSAELASNISEGGIYQWCRLAFGERMGFLAVWLQWINNVVWFPTLLLFIAGTATYLINPALSQNKYFMISMVLIIFWSLTLINLKGIQMSAKFTSFCAVTGLIVPMALIIGLLFVWLALGNPLQIHLTPHSILPDFKHSDNWIALSAIMLSFAGMELATVHVKDVNEPQKTFPRALALSSVFILITMMLGSLAIAFVVPENQINLVNGTIQSFSYFLSAYHLSWLTPVLTTLLIIGALGGSISWILSPVKGIAQAAGNGFLPPFFKAENKHGVAQNLLITQAVFVSLICLVMLLLPSVNGSYWLLSTLSTQLYMLMYVLMFASALFLRKKGQYLNQGFTIPGKKYGLWAVCALGLMGCAITLFVGFIPPSNINIGSKLNYIIIFCTGMVGLILPVFGFYLYHAKSTRKLVLADDTDTPVIEGEPA
jgi:amino acid transporter